MLHYFTLSQQPQQWVASNIYCSHQPQQTRVVGEIIGAIAPYVSHELVTI